MFLKIIKQQWCTIVWVQSEIEHKIPHILSRSSLSYSHGKWFKSCLTFWILELEFRFFNFKKVKWDSEHPDIVETSRFWVRLGTGFLSIIQPLVCSIRTVSVSFDPQTVEILHNPGYGTFSDTVRITGTLDRTRQNRNVWQIWNPLFSLVPMTAAFRVL